jgi:hypothetical protein
MSGTPSTGKEVAPPSRVAVSSPPQPSTAGGGHTNIILRQPCEYPSEVISSTINRAVTLCKQNRNGVIQLTNHEQGIQFRWTYSQKSEAFSEQRGYTPDGVPQSAVLTETRFRKRVATLLSEDDDPGKGTFRVSISGPVLPR